MSQLLFLAIILLQLALTTSVVAQDKNNAMSLDDQEKTQTIALELATCSGVYSMISDINMATGHSDLAKSLHENANGSVVASAWLISSMGIISDWQDALKYAENTANSEKVRWQGIFEASQNKNVVITNLTESMNICNQLGDLQAELVQQARIWAYSKKSKK